MKKPDIEKHLNKKFVELLKDLSLINRPSHRLNTVLSRGYFAGGCIASLLSNDRVNDYDFYFQSDEDAQEVKLFIKAGYKNLIAFESDNALSLTNGFQLMLKYNGQADKVVASFDFRHIKAYMMPYKRLYYNTDIHMLLLQKELIYDCSMFPLASLMRTRKYIKRGFHIPAEQMTKIVFDIMIVLGLEEKGKPYDIDTIKLERAKYHMDVDLFIRQLSGIDPMTIQLALQEHMGQSLSFERIIEIINTH